MSDREVTRDQVREEHLRSVNQRNQAIYMVAVIGGAFVIMVILIAILGAGR